MRAPWLRVIAAFAMAVSGCLDLSVERYCAQYPELCSARAQSVSPQTAPFTGGTEVTVFGYGFEAPASVTVAGIEATDVRVISSEELRFTTAGGAAGCAPVEIRTGQATLSLSCSLVYLGPVEIVEVSTMRISTGGGEVVQVRGKGLAFVSLEAEGRMANRVNVREADELALINIGGGPAGAFALKLTNTFMTATVALEAEAPWTDAGVLELPAGASARAVAVDAATPGGAWLLDTEGALLTWDPQAATWHQVAGAPSTSFSSRLVSAPSGELFVITEAGTHERSAAGWWSPVQEANLRDVLGYDDGVWLVTSGALKNRTTGDVIGCPEDNCTRACRAGSRWFVTGGGGGTGGNAVFRRDGAAWTRLPGTAFGLRCSDTHAFVKNEQSWARMAADTSEVPPRVSLTWGGAPLTPFVDLEAAGSYVMTAISGVILVSHDAGDTWIRAPSAPLGANTSAIDATGALVVAVPNGPVFVGTIDEASATHTGLPGRSHVIGLENVPPGSSRLFARTPGAIARSDDSGATWEWLPFEAFSRPTRIGISLTQPSRLYLGTARGVVRSDDGGLNWIATGLNEPVVDISVAPSNAEDVLAATPLGVYRSLDGGAQWELLQRPLHASSAHCVVHAGAPLTQRIFACFDTRVFSSDAAGSWAIVPDLVRAIRIDASPTHGTLFAKGESGGAFISGNAGDAWSFFSSADRVSLPDGPGVPVWYLDRGTPIRRLFGLEQGPSWTSLSGGVSAIAAATWRDAWVILESGGVLRTRVGGR